MKRRKFILVVAILLAIIMISNITGIVFAAINDYDSGIMLRYEQFVERIRADGEGRDICVLEEDTGCGSKYFPSE